MSSPSQRDAHVRSALFVGSLAVYAATATPGAFLLDSSELAAAGATLGVPHPPGHPLYVMLGYVASLLPIGAVGWRIAMLSAVFGAASVVLTYDVARLLARRGGEVTTRRWPACVGAIVFGLSGALWLQSVRAEVYTLQLFVALWLTRLALGWAAAPAPRPAAPPLLAAFATGLAAGNHHLLLVAHLPALALLVAPDAAARRALPRRLVAMLPAGLAGFVIYALLPLRALTTPLIDYGAPSTLPRLVDVVLARVFVRSVSGASTPLADNLVGALSMFLDALGPVVLLAAVAGCILLLRRGDRLVAVAIAVAIAGNLATKVTMDLDPTNPDAAGYFLASMALVAVLATLPLEALARLPGSASRPAALTIASVMGVGALASVDLERVDLHAHRAPAIIDTALTSGASPDALALTSFFGLHFDRLYGIAAPGVRPDVRPMHQGMEDHIDGGRPHADAARRRDPRLGPVLAAKLATGRFPAEPLLEHASQRPVYVEPTFSLPLDVGRLEYAGGWFRIVPGSTPPRRLLARQAADQAALLSALGPEATGQRETRTTLMLLWLQLAVVRVQQGDAEAADLALQLVGALRRGDRYVDRLRPFVGALRQTQDDPRRLAQVRQAIQTTDFAAVVLGGAPGPFTGR